MTKPAKPTLATSLARQQWLEKAVTALRAHFLRSGYTIPEKVRVSIGWPRRAASCGAIGECWASEASSDRHAELFLAPTMIKAARILDVLAHELAHATVGHKAGHGPVFKRCATAIGLTGPMRATIADEAFTTFTATVINKIGPYPSGYLTVPTNQKKQTTRLLKCECRDCGYIARTTSKWIADAGAPVCPTHETQMEVTS